MRFLRPVRRFGESLAGRCRLNPVRLLAGFSAPYPVGTGLIAARKPLWYDELFTISLSRLSCLSDLWSALAAGTDLNPPLGYLASRVVNSFLGENPVAVRLPAVLGFWVMC